LLTKLEPNNSAVDRLPASDYKNRALANTGGAGLRNDPARGPQIAFRGRVMAVISTRTLRGTRLLAAAATVLLGAAASAAAQEGPIKIGLSGALTGGDAVLGQTQREGVALAVDEINAAGGINGRKIKLVVEDEANDPSRMAEIAQRFVSLDAVDAIIGGTNDGTAQVLAQVAEQAEVPLIIPFANGDQITRDRKWSFQVDVSSTTFVKALVDYAIQKYKKVGIIYDDNAFGQADRDFALADLKEAKVDPVAVIPIPDVGRDYTPQLTQLRAAGAEVLIAPISGTNAAQLRKDMTRLGYEPLIIGPNSLAFQTMIDVGQGFVEHKVMFLDLIDESKPEVQQFQQKMQAAYKRRATSGFELLGYDAMKILAYAMQKGGGDKAKVRDALEGLSGYTAVSGKAGSTISYSPTDHRRASPADLVWRWVDGGKFANAVLK
jgi:branched-chain amino acid transport system substrate-binding protein